MQDAVRVTQISMNQDRQLLQSINHNISNMQTPGFKRVLDNLQIHTQGALNETQNPLDLALNGPGFFEEVEKYQKEENRRHTKFDAFQDLKRDPDWDLGS